MKCRKKREMHQKKYFQREQFLFFILKNRSDCVCWRKELYNCDSNELNAKKMFQQDEFHSIQECEMLLICIAPLFIDCQCWNNCVIPLTSENIASKNHKNNVSHHVFNQFDGSFIFHLSNRCQTTYTYMVVFPNYNCQHLITIVSNYNWH